MLAQLYKLDIEWIFGGMPRKHCEETSGQYQTTREKFWEPVVSYTQNWMGWFQSFGNARME
jgi:hypothetical protein